MIIFCPFCRKEPTVETDPALFAPVTRSIECCGVKVACRTPIGTERRWNEIARGIHRHRAFSLRKRLERKPKPARPASAREVAEALADSLIKAGNLR